MKISIVTITKNSEKTLQETIDSIKNQNQEDMEIEYIIIDGGSKDHTIDIIKTNSDFISYWISEPDRGISDAFNKGIIKASGEIVGIINSDDILLPRALKCIKDHYDAGIDIYFGNAKRLTIDGTLTEYKANPNLELLKKGMYLVHPAVFVRNEAYKKYGMFDINLRCVMDRDILLRMHSAGAMFRHIDESLVVFRDGGASWTQFFSNVLPEEEMISVKYGMNPLAASVRRYYNWIYMHLVFIIKRIKRKMI